jgi:hypothetical protein
VGQNSSANEAQVELSAEGFRSALIAARLRQHAGAQPSPADARLPWYALEQAISGDLGHLHAAHDLGVLPVVSNRRLVGPIVVRVKRALLRGLQPLTQSQSVWNGANARVVTFLVGQLATQERALESLERQVYELYGEPPR